MSRLSAYDLRRANDLAAVLRERRESTPEIVDVALPGVRELLATEVTCGYRIQRDEEGAAAVEFVKLVGAACTSAEAAAACSNFFRRMKARRGFFDPIRPEAAQRNRVANLPFSEWCAGDGPEDIARHIERAAPEFGLPAGRLSDAAETIWELEVGFRDVGMGGFNHLRVLLCDGDTLLTWFGALQGEPFSERQRLLLKRVAEPLRERLIVERRTRGGGLGHAAMVAALEHVPAAAFVLDGAGRIVHANAVGRHRLEVQGSAMRLALARAVRNGHKRPEFAMTELAGPGMPARYLVMCGSRSDRVRFGIERARRRWQLTAREVEVLAELAAGRANRDIADRLGAAPRTVELHVSAILRKAHADSRSQLVIDLWHLADAA